MTSPQSTSTRHRGGAFVPGSDIVLEPTAEGRLSGTTFAAKDLFDVKGYVTGCGNPDWKETHSPAEKTSPAIATLLASGARLVGKTIMDELAYSLSGQNIHYGAPTNPAAPGRITGGSSCGSASATSAAVCDFALGTDTGGSVRVPASYCGLYGIRPTHGRISLENVMPLAPSFDTVGWFARSPDILRRVGCVLLGEESATLKLDRLFVAEDFFALAAFAIQAALEPKINHIKRHFSEHFQGQLGNDDLSKWRECFQTIQAHEIWQIHSRWITEHNPRFGEEINQRFKWAAQVTDNQTDLARGARQRITQNLEKMLGDNTVVVMPTVPGIAPLQDASGDALAEHRTRALIMTSAAGLGGMPQVTVPAVKVFGCPVGLSFIGTRGSDLALLDLVDKLDLS